MKPTKLFIYLLTVLAIICLPAIGHAQIIDPGCNPDLPCPIDGGLSLLIAAGVGLGARRAYKKQHAAKEQDLA